MPRVLFVSKPISAPFDDGTKNLVRDLATELGDEAEVLVRAGAGGLPCGERPIFGPSDAGHALGLGGAARLLRHLATARLPPILHWVFTPSPRSHRLPSIVARLRRRATVWTIPSVPTAAFRFDLGGIERLLVLSASTAEALVARGVPPSRIDVQAPWLAPLAMPTSARVDACRVAFGLSGRITTFVGDLGPGRGADVLLEAFAQARSADDLLVIAARPKGADAAAHRRTLVTRAAALGRVRFVDTVPDMHALLAASDVVALPATRLDAKVDVPLVLLEALALGRAVLVAEGSSAAVLADQGAARAAPPTAEDLAAALTDLYRRPDERARLGAKGVTLVASGYDVKAVARSHRALYDALWR